MNIAMPYGKSFVEIEVPSTAVIIEPLSGGGLRHEKTSFIENLRNPISSPPLRELISAGDRVVIVTSDNTRPLPNDTVVPWILEELNHLRMENITALIGTGSHRSCSHNEIVSMFGTGPSRNLRIINHNAYDRSDCAVAGETKEDGEIFLNRVYLEADKRITLGFIEPHFFAGFSGGPKALMPGIAGIDNIMRFHSASMIRNPRSTWGVLQGNPVYNMACRTAHLAKPDFSINITMNPAHNITGIFCGDVFESHKSGAAFAKNASMSACDGPYDIVITSNSGHPLDRNFYQTVKGICAAGEIVKDGGYILCFSQCTDGIPHGSHFHSIMRMRESPIKLLEMMDDPSFSQIEAWQAYKLAAVLVKAAVHLFSALSTEDVTHMHCLPSSDPQATITQLLRRHSGARIAVLRYGPISIPYIK